jgi:hypothetical protein
MDWRSAIVILLALPGALAAMWVGVMAAAFSGAGPTSGASVACWLLWGVFGGACFGALPGLLVGILMRVRWVFPFLGGALGTLPGLTEAFGVHVLGGTNLGGFLAAGCVLVGFLTGLWIWFATAPREQKISERSKRELAAEMEAAINAGPPPRSAR